MIAATSIEWTDRTWNPVTGCTKVSPGCKHCYAETVAKRLWASQYSEVGPSGSSLDEYPVSAAEGLVMDGLTRKRRFTDVWTHPDRLDEPLRWRKPARVFVNSMSDLFHEDVPESFLDDTFAVMALVSQHGRDEHHTMQVLTKRAERALRYLSDPKTPERVAAAAAKICYPKLPVRLDTENERAGCLNALRKGTFWPLPNVWLGVSVENQETADERIPLLLQAPAAVRFLSVEPLLGPVSLGLNLGVPLADGTRWGGSKPLLDWIIVGGESGPGARPCDVAWIRSVVEQCRATGTPVFCKQLGANVRDVNDGRFAPSAIDDEVHGAWPDPTEVEHNPNGFREEYQGAPVRVLLRNRKGGTPEEWPADLRVREWPEVRP